MAAGSIPHTLIQDDIYEGYFPPKGTILFANAWGIYRDEDEYELPDKFIPARFMSNKYSTQHSNKASDDHRRVTYGFGAGRRVFRPAACRKFACMSPRCSLCDERLLH
jgi:cytochrome P450